MAGALLIGAAIRQKASAAALLEKIRTSLWIVPIGYMTCAAGLALALLRLDHELSLEHSPWFFYGGRAEGARALLSTIASSMLTIAGLVFSITILVLQLASSQFSPRVLHTFLRDRITQRAMGLFLGSFVYTMMLLPEVRSETDSSSAFVPGFSVFFAFGLALVSVGMFVQYIHHMAHSIRVVNIIARVAQETYASFERLYPEALLDEPSEPVAEPEGAPELVIENVRRGGVVISVDESALMEVALERELVIVVVPRVGDFVCQGAPLLKVWGRCERDAIGQAEWIALSPERTPHQDAIYGFRQLVDIATRALSPGINDPTTATQAMDHLHDLLRSLARREIPAPARMDREGKLRLWLPRPDWPDYVRLTFEEIRSYGAGSLQVVRRARVALEDLLTVTQDARAAVVREELDRLNAMAARELPSEARMEGSTTVARALGAPR